MQTSTINFLMYDRKSSIPWVNDYKSLYAHELLRLGHDVRWVKSVAGMDGYLILGHYSEYLTYLKEEDGYNYDWFF